MAQWQELLNLNSTHQNQVIQLYADQNLPWEIRRYLSDWIEGQNWESAAVDEREARDCFLGLLQMIEEQHRWQLQRNNLLEGPNFLHLKSYVQGLFEDNPLKMATIIFKCLSEERKVLDAAKNAQDCTPNNAVMERDMDNYIRELKTNIQDADCKIKAFNGQFETYNFCMKAWQNKVKQLNGLPLSQDLTSEKTNIDAVFTILKCTREAMGHLMGTTLKLVENVVSTIIDKELAGWKQRQQKACIGAPVDANIKQLQMWFTTVAEVLNQQLQQLKRLLELDQKSPPSQSLFLLRNQCEETTLGLFRRLLENALVVEKQPCMTSSPQRPLVLKTGVHFTLKTRFLVRPEFHSMSLKVTLIFDKDFDEIGAVNRFRKFNFKNNVVSKTLHAEESGALVAEFEKLSLEEEKSKSNRPNESLLLVTEELHFITLVTELTMADLTFDIETCSLPVVVISSSNQAPAAWASILWSNMQDSKPKSLLFSNPPPVTWQQLSEVLSWQFFSTSQRGLDDHQLSVLREKFVDNQDDLVHWSRFYKSDGTWIWVEGILDLIKKHLLSIWRDGHIMGFVSRDAAEALLNERPGGTFLLRFSESNKDGAITFSWVDRSKGEPHVYAVEPYTKKDLSVTSLPDIINTYHMMASGRSSNMNPLVYLYPDVPKDRAFEQYYSKPETQVNGYLIRIPMHVSMDPTPSPPSPQDEDMDFWIENLPTEFDLGFSNSLLNLEKGLCE